MDKPMLENNNASVDSNASAAPTPVTGAGNDYDLDSVDGIAAALDDMGADPQGDGDAAAGQQGESVPSNPDSPGNLSKPADGSVQEGAGPEVSAPVDQYAPEGWERDKFLTLPEDVRGLIQQREQGHAEALAAEKRNQAALKQDAMRFADGAGKEMQSALSIMQSVLAGDFQSVDWDALKSADPARYVALRDGFSQRVAAVQQVQQQVQALQAAQSQAQDKALQAHMSAERDAVLPELKALFGAAWEPKKFTADLSGYLTAQGVPADVQGQISNAYELKLAAKAMLYDRLQAGKAAAEQKIADAPKISVKNPNAADGSDAYKRAYAALHKNPNSTEALANVLGAM